MEARKEKREQEEKERTRRKQTKHMDALIDAVKKGDVDSVREELQHLRDPPSHWTHWRKDPSYALCTAMEKKQTECALEMIFARNRDGSWWVDLNRRIGGSPLVCAIEDSGDPALISALLDARHDDGSWRVDVNEASSYPLGLGALASASKFKRHDAARLLINARNDDGTPRLDDGGCQKGMNMACAGGMEWAGPIIDALLDARDPKTGEYRVKNLGVCAFRAMRQYKPYSEAPYLAVLQKLLTASDVETRLNLTTQWSFMCEPPLTPLQTACSRNFKECVQLLADVAQRTQDQASFDSHIRAAIPLAEDSTCRDILEGFLSANEIVASDSQPEQKSDEERE